MAMELQEPENGVFLKSPVKVYHMPFPLSSVANSKHFDNNITKCFFSQKTATVAM